MNVETDSIETYKPKTIVLHISTSSALWCEYMNFAREYPQESIKERLLQVLNNIQVSRKDVYLWYVFFEIMYVFNNKNPILYNFFLILKIEANSKFSLFILSNY